MKQSQHNPRDHLGSMVSLCFDIPSYGLLFSNSFHLRARMKKSWPAMPPSSYSSTTPTPPINDPVSPVAEPEQEPYDVTRTIINSSKKFRAPGTYCVVRFTRSLMPIKLEQFLLNHLFSVTLPPVFSQLRGNVRAVKQIAPATEPADNNNLWLTVVTYETIEEFRTAMNTWYLIQKNILPNPLNIDLLDGGFCYTMALFDNI